RPWEPQPSSRAPSQQRPWGQRPSRAPSSQSSPCRRQPWEQRPSSRPASSRQPLVNLLDLHEVSDRTDVPTVGRGVLTHDDIADALEAQAAQGVALVLLLADNGLCLGHLETGGHQAPTFAVAATRASSSARTRRSGATASKSSP